MWLFEKNFNSLNPHFSIMMVVMMVIIMGSVFLSLSVVVSQKWRFEKDKLTSFECGFDPMSSSRMPFSLRFFLLALLFLVFDLEMILLFPYVFSVSVTSIKMKVISKLWGFIFLIILVGGLVHELNEGTLDWNKE
ncbi:NADH dehydrogenase subunit 3 (mitochondrion) [Ruditapes philippinarum]|uniref:NADH-ubiquinone oxidoreductase chain 3 n=1 Tax=Ruditapes philippinarum TaxID=129788 RepID=A0A0H4T3D2_RUDPH|nr:NADH dehydrogenase subunit 3 [Ruditapes philippinarum]AKP94717.1 NADH dehydrogenase subunit 3 [Ruditapes philippinarum]